MANFIVDEDIPTYAILSHTWSEEEVSLQDWQTLSSFDLNKLKGYSKIQRCCEQAQRDGFEWVWVDTCCIDKTSSAELSEAINSMFRWYQNAAICYAFLSDVPDCEDTSTAESNLAKSRWFTRGWTLQELIAPENLTFFSMDWHPLGTKAQIHNILSSITGIEKKFLNSKNLELASTAKRMSWAASRKTSRVEDVAYSLLGIFDISMPLIYGEGKKAFRRLQEEIIKTRGDDHSLFAWGTVVSTPSMKISDLSLYLDQEPVKRSQEFVHQPLLDLLAESPRDFSSSGGFIPIPFASVYYRGVTGAASLPLVVNGGIRIDLPLLEAFDSVYQWDQLEIEQIRTAKTVALLCYPETSRTSFLKLPIQRWGAEYFGRSRDIIIEDVAPIFKDSGFFKLCRMITVAAERRTNLEIGDLILRRHVFPDSNHCLGIHLFGFGETHNSNAVIEARKLRSGHKFGYFYTLENLSPLHGFGILLSRNADAGEPGDSLLAELFAMDLTGAVKNLPTNNKRVGGYGINWWPCTKKLDVAPTHFHTMKLPLDIWNLDIEPFPRISVRAERMRFDKDESFVDVLDMIVWPSTDSDAQFRRLEAWGRD